MIDYDPITINNPTGEAWRQCQMGRREQMIRELVMNAVEACRHKPDGERDVRLYGAVNHKYSAPKLAIWNRGGMRLSALKQFSNINATIDKQNSVEDNFGRGAKIASIMSNQLGMRFRSCYAGRVLEVTLAAIPEKQMVVRVGVDDAVDGTSYIRDVTAEYPGDHSFLNLETDWTEVVLMGNQPEQDTTRVPFLDADLPQSFWLFNALGFRFFQLPDGVKIRLYSPITRHRASGGNNGKPYWISFFPMKESAAQAARFTTVPFEGGVIHYIYARDRETVGKFEKSFGPEYVSRQERATPFGGLVWRGEIHELHAATSQARTTLTAKPWPPLALRWGLVRSYNQVSILVELNDDQARNDINRVELVDRDGIRIEPDRFAEVVSANMPEWVRDLEKALEPKEEEALQNIRQYLRDLIREFRDFDLGLSLGGEDVAARPVKDGQGDGEAHNGRAKKGQGLEETEDQANAERRRRFIEAPLAEWVDNRWFEEQGLAGMAGHYVRSAGRPGTIFFNEEHDVFRSLVRAIASRLPEIEVNLVYDVATQAAKRVAYLAVGTHVVAALSLLQFGVQEEPVFNALGSVVLTTALATTRFSRHFPESVAEAKRQLRTRLMESAEPQLELAGAA